MQFLFSCEMCTRDAYGIVSPEGEIQHLLRADMDCTTLTILQETGRLKINRPVSITSFVYYLTRPRNPYL
jgi:hypothetical protein